MNIYQLIKNFESLPKIQQDIFIKGIRFGMYLGLIIIVIIFKLLKITL